jgi:hypothetical protein
MVGYGTTVGYLCINTKKKCFNIFFTSTAIIKNKILCYTAHVVHEPSGLLFTLRVSMGCLTIVESRAESPLLRLRPSAFHTSNRHATSLTDMKKKERNVNKIRPGTYNIN